MDEVAERFLEEDAGVKVQGLDPLDRARFARLVRQCAANWLLHPQAGLRITRGRYGLSLHFEGPLGGKALSIFSFRAQHKTGEYRFMGPNPDRKRLGLKPAAASVLERLRDLYEALLSGREGAGETVVASLNGKRLPDLVPLVEETRRALDGSADGASLAPPQPPRRKRAQKTGKGSRKTAATGASSPTRRDRPMTRLVLLRLASPDPKATAEFWARLLKTRPEKRDKDGRATFRLGNLTLEVTPDLDRDARRILGWSTPPKSRGFGAIPTFAVSDFDLCLRRARRMKTAILVEDVKARRFTVRDPAGYTAEITEA